ncbi:hypothetical protein LAZ67_10000973 [Cordylochernes scorpioides]|uniref:Uncharacterized protein n=1 Tax=Cordylochernes scorpioides TaxID=51811 RepID=A0ABY6KZ66_9ARAC|nr:hypothetical protein LAZ67_10000973 [Cordylochernes scorpioides]
MALKGRRFNTRESLIADSKKVRDTGQDTRVKLGKEGWTLAASAAMWQALKTAFLCGGGQSLVTYAARRRRGDLPPGVWMIRQGEPDIGAVYKTV